MPTLAFPELILVVLVAGGYGLWLFTLVKVAQEETVQGGRRAFWIVFLVVTQFVGAGIYWFLRLWRQSRGSAGPAPVDTGL
jgi:hypothetical protein